MIIFLCLYCLSKEPLLIISNSICLIQAIPPLMLIGQYLSLNIVWLIIFCILFLMNNLITLFWDLFY